MIVKGNVVGYQVFQSGACQMFVTSPASPSEKVHEFGAIVRSLWQGKGTYNFLSPPQLLGAQVTAYVGKNESGIIDIKLPPEKGGVDV